MRMAFKCGQYRGPRRTRQAPGLRNCDVCPRPRRDATLRTPMAHALTQAKFRDLALEPVRERVLAGRRLGFDDGVALYKTHDLLALGSLANHVREQRHGDAAYFVWNSHLNHTNVCVATCDFCAFAARKGEERAYTMGLDDVFKN